MVEYKNIPLFRYGDHTLQMRPAIYLEKRRKKSSKINKREKRVFMCIVLI